MLAFCDMRNRSFVVVCAGLIAVGCAHAQATHGPPARDPDPLHFLQTIAPLHLQPYYHVEVEIQEENTSEYSQYRSKTFSKAIVAPDHRFRFGTRSELFSWLQVSDGTTEWTYDRENNQYIQQPVSANSPFEFRNQWSYQQGKLNDTHKLLQELAEMPGRLRTAAYLPDETITLNGQPIACIVIEGDGKFRPGGSPDIRSRLTFWVDQQTHLIRQVRERMEGALTVGRPQLHEVRETTSRYSILQLGSPKVDQDLFVFRPALDASLVKSFSSESYKAPARSAGLIGKPAPDLTLRALDGTSASLRSFLGKPLLIEFWATWCAPCVESVPAMMKLYAQAAPHGLAMIAIDEDDDPAKVRGFLARRKPPWPNFHDDGEAARTMAGDGIPQFVLIDASGTIRFADSGFDESALRAAIAKLGPEFAWINRRPVSKP